MSNSVKAKLRRQRRSKLSKHQRDALSRQHFGDEFVYKGRPLMRGQNKADLMRRDKEEDERNSVRKGTGNS